MDDYHKEQPYQGAKKKRLLVFHPALAPYRVDFFNVLADKFDCVILFLQKNNRNQNFNQQVLLSRSRFRCSYMKIKLVVYNRDINFGYIYYILKYKPDIVISIEYGLPTILSYLYKKIFRLSYSLYTICDDCVEIAKTCRGIRKRARDFFASRLSGIIFTSSNVVKWYKENVSGKTNGLAFPIIRDERIYWNYLNDLIPVSSRLRRDFKIDNKKVILYVGRITKVKNLQTLVRAFGKTHLKDTVLVIVGDGDEKHSIKQIIMDLDITDKVILTGRREGDELYAWYNLSNLFVLPSVYEPFGAVTAEALQAGCPVLCSNVAGSSSLINGNNGTLFNPNDEEELSHLMSEFVSRCNVLSLSSARKSILHKSFKDYVDCLASKLK